MPTIEEVKARLIKSIALCDDVIGHHVPSALDLEYVQGQRDAFMHILRFIMD